MTVPPAPIRVPNQRPFSPSIASSANDMGDNEMIPGAGHRSLTPENLNQQNVNEGSATSHRLKWSPLPPNEIGRIAQHHQEGRWRERRKGLPQTRVLTGNISRRLLLSSTFSNQTWVLYFFSRRNTLMTKPEQSLRACFFS